MRKDKKMNKMNNFALLLAVLLSAANVTASNISTVNEGVDSQINSEVGSTPVLPVQVRHFDQLSEYDFEKVQKPIIQILEMLADQPVRPLERTRFTPDEKYATIPTSYRKYYIPQSVYNSVVVNKICEVSSTTSTGVSCLAIEKQKSRSGKLLFSAYQLTLGKWGKIPNYTHVARQDIPSKQIKGLYKKLRQIMANEPDGVLIITPDEFVKVN